MASSAPASGTEMGRAAVAVAVPVAETRIRTSSLWRDGARRLLRNRLALAGGIVVVLLCLVAIFADFLAPLPYTKSNFGRLNEAPSREYPLGTDQLGRDLLSRIIYGARVSMLVGLGAQVIVVLIGVPIGALSGYLGGRMDIFLTRFIDVMYAFPRLLFVILVMSALGAGLMNIFIAIGLTGWVGIARQTRAQVLAIKEKEFVDGARALGVGRREFLKLAAGLAAMGPAGFNAQPAAAAPKLAPGEKLAKDQTFRYGGGGWWQDDPTSHDFNKDLYCNGAPALFAGLMKFNADHQSVLYVASKVSSSPDGSQWIFTIRKDSKWSDGSPCTARDFEWSWKRQLDPASAAPYAAFLYDIKNAQAFNKKEITDPSQVGVRAKDDWTLEVMLEGPRGYFPVLAAFLAALPAHRASVDKHADKWTEPANIVCNGPFVLETWQHGKVMLLRENKHVFGPNDATRDTVTIPINPVASGALPYENNEIDLTSLQTGDLKRLQSSPKTVEEIFRYPFPGTWYLTPQ